MGYYEKIQRMTLILLEIVSLGAPPLLLMFSVSSLICYVSNDKAYAEDDLYSQQEKFTNYINA